MKFDQSIVLYMHINGNIKSTRNPNNNTATKQNNYRRWKIVFGRFDGILIRFGVLKFGAYTRSSIFITIYKLIYYHTLVIHPIVTCSRFTFAKRHVCVCVVVHCCNRKWYRKISIKNHKGNRIKWKCERKKPRHIHFETGYNDLVHTNACIIWCALANQMIYIRFYGKSFLLILNYMVAVNAA